MTKINLKSQKRDVVGKKVKAHKKNGIIPAVMYGHKIAPENLWVKQLDIDKVFEETGESTIIELEVEGGKNVNVLIHDVQLDNLTGRLSHVDFFQVRMDEKIEATVPLEFVGEAPAVKSLGGIFLKGIDEVDVRCLPADLPSEIQVDIAVLATFDDHIKVKDLKISDKVKVLVDPETVIAGVSAPRTEEELAKLNEKVEEDVTKVESTAKKPEGEGTEAAAK